MRRGGVFVLRATLLRFQVPEEENERDEEGDDEEGEDGLEDESEDAGEPRNGLARFLHALDDLLDGLLDGAGVEEGESSDLCGAIAGGEGNSRTGQHPSRLRSGGGFSRQFGGRCDAIAAAEIQRSRDGDRFRKGKGDMEGVRFVGSFSLEWGLIVRAAEREILRRPADGEGHGNRLPVIVSGNSEDFPIFRRFRIDSFSEDRPPRQEEGAGGGMTDGQVEGVPFLRALEHALLLLLLLPHGAVQRIVDPESAEGTMPFLVLHSRLMRKRASREEEEGDEEEQGKRAAHDIMVAQLKSK